MICPKCGKIDRAVAVPESTPWGATIKLGKCLECGIDVFAVPTQRAGERSQLDTVATGERREVILADIYVQHLGGGFSHRSRSAAADIDRIIYDQDGLIHHYLEIKERTCSLNAYRMTQFPYAKIEEAAELHRLKGKPVRFLLKFIDSWAYFDFDPDEKYIRGQEAFAPRYRPWQKNSTRQVPVKKSVESLRILDIDKYCARSQS